MDRLCQSFSKSSSSGVAQYKELECNHDSEGDGEASQRTSDSDWRLPIFEVVCVIDINVVRHDQNT
jgi:hypothetical protein